MFKVNHENLTFDMLTPMEIEQKVFGNISSGRLCQLSGPDRCVHVRGDTVGAELDRSIYKLSEAKSTSIESR